MPRTPSNPITIEQSPRNEALLREDDRKAQRIARLQEEVLAQYGDGKPYERRRLIIECRGLVVATGEALLELGRRLIVLKEHEPHGEFLQALREIGIEPRFARKAMQAALKFSDAKRPSTAVFAGLGQAKLIELLVLDDEQVEALAEGGTVADASLDEIDRMSTRELRARLREERAQRRREREVHERILVEKNRKLDELDAQLARREAATEEERDRRLADDTWRAAFHCAAAQIQLLKCFRAIGEAHPSGLPASLRLAREHALTYLMQLLLELQEQFAVDVHLQEMVSPPWLQDFHDRVAQEVGPQ